MEVASKNEGRVIERGLTSKPPIYAPRSKEDFFLSFKNLKTYIVSQRVTYHCLSENTSH